MWSGTITLKNSLEITQKIKNRVTIWPKNSIQCVHVGVCVCVCAHTHSKQLKSSVYQNKKQKNKTCHASIIRKN